MAEKVVMGSEEGGRGEGSEGGARVVAWEGGWEEA